MSGIEHLSLVNGPVPVLLGVVAFAVLGLSFVWIGRRGWLGIGLLAIGSLAAVVAAGTAIGIEHRVGSTFPHTFFLWAALPVFAIALAAWRWPRWSGSRRAMSVVSVVLVAAFGAECVNVHYAYLPTVGDAIGRPVEDQVPTRTVLVPMHGGALAGRLARPPVSGRGVVLKIDIPGARSRFRARRAMVWLPPAYFGSPSPALPLVLLLGGVPGDPVDLLRAAHLARIADRYAAAHDGVAPILVFPDENGGFFNDTECVDGPRGNAETYLTVDVPRYLGEHFHASVLGGGLGIGGYSEGGTCAATLALRHPDEFGAFVDVAGDFRPNAASGPSARQLTVRRLYGGDARQWPLHDPLTLLRHQHGTRAPLALFAAGQDDAHAVAAMRTLASATKRARLATLLRYYGGGHTYLLAHRAFADLLPVLGDDLLPVRGAAGVTTRRPWAREGTGCGRAESLVMGSRRSAALVVIATIAALSLTSAAIAHPGKGSLKPKHPHGSTTTTTSASTTSTTSGSTTTTTQSTTTTTTSAALPLPTPTAADGVGPGDWIEITQADGTVGCTANFVWVDTAGNHYLGTAGHCLLPQPDPLTGEGGLAEATAAKLATIDTDIKICTSSCLFGGQAGFLLNGSVGTEIDLGRAGFYARQYPDGKPDALGDDFALIKLPAGLPIRPGVPVWGGPTGAGTLEAGGTVCLYGNGEGVGETFPTKARSGVGMSVEADGNGGPPSWYANIPSFEGDSGAAVVNCTLGPNGLVGTTAVGLLTDLVVGTTPGVVEGTTVAQAVAMTRADTGVRISVVNG